MKTLSYLYMLSIAASAVAGASLFASDAPPPNIVYFYADDLGWGTVKANNASSELITPAIDSLVDTGINFTRGYGATVCSPARSSQQTGFHQGHTWSDRNDPNATKAIRKEDTSLGTILQQAGYRTAYYGKWGYGADQTRNNPAINNPQTLPINHGYDELLAELHHIRAHSFFQPTLWRTNTNDAVPTTALVPNTIEPNNPLRPNYPAFQDDPSYPTTAYADDSYAIAALDFVRTQAQTDQPFFVTLAFQVPHTPLDDIIDTPNWFDAYSGVVGSDSWTAASKQFAAMVTRMDAHMQNILDVLEDPNGDGDTSDSVRENTLIIFASDNGAQSGSFTNFFSTNGILSGYKGSLQEGAIRVPTVMNWRGTIAAGQSSDMPTDVTDLMPTLAELAGVPAPVGTDGVSIAPTLTRVGVQRTREFLAHEDSNEWSIIQGDMKLRDNGSLYDLGSDPDESSNIAAAHPATVAELQAYAVGEFLGLEDNFANSFRTWEGSDGSAFEADASWSNPAYPPGHALANDYSPNTPNSRWNAVMRNNDSVDSTSTLAADVQLLAIEVGGNTNSAHTQTLTVPAGLTLTGRNEIRIADHGIIELDGGTLDTLRWVDVFANGRLTKGGTITGHLYNAGSVQISATSNGPSEGAEQQEILVNGGFETVSGNGSYPTVANWSTEDGFDTSRELAKNSNAHSGTYRGLIHGVSSAPYGAAIQETAHRIALNDQYRLSFWHRAFSNWEATDQLRAELFYLNDLSQRVTLYTTTITPTSGVWTQANRVPAAISDGDAVGRTLWVRFTPDQASEGSDEWASVDDISLTVDVVPASPTPGGEVRSLSVAKDFHQLSTGRLEIELNATGSAGLDYGHLDVSGTAYLSGSLDLIHTAGFIPQTGDSFTIVFANAVSGRFQHADDLITVGEHHYQITYGVRTVTIQKVAATRTGTPHSWLSGHELGTDDLSDDDNDSLSTWEEFIAGTDPTDPNSLFELEIESTSQSTELQWTVQSDRRYYVDSTPNLRNDFSQLAGPLETEASIHNYSLPPSSSPQQFFRIRVERK
jgi:arylsulfatase A-like enzyme